MRRAIIRAAALTLWRDRPAFALTFLLPPLIFAIFALVFANATGGDISIRLGVYAGNDALSQRLLTKLETAPEVTTLIRASSPESLASAVQSGDASVGIEIIRTPGKSIPDFVLYKDATRTAAALTGEKVLAQLRPDAAIGKSNAGDAPDENADQGATLAHQTVNPVNADAPMAAYYAAGVSVFFLLLSGFQTALTLIEERDDGVMQRLMAGKAGIAPVIDGKFLFIVIQGVLQTVAILIAATLLFDVTILFAPLALTISILASATACAGIVLAVTTYCQSRAQAHAVGAILSLVLAAIGGSMAPSFLMPTYMQIIGGATPVGLAIESFSASLWRGGGIGDAVTPSALLLLYGLIGLVIARIRAETLMRED